MHPHLHDPAFGELLVWGIDELLVYHYLVAEAFRYPDQNARHIFTFPGHQIV